MIIFLSFMLEEMKEIVNCFFQKIRGILTMVGTILIFY